MKKSTFGRTFFSLAEAVVELAQAGFNVTIAALCDYALNNLLQLSVLLPRPTPVRFGWLDQNSPALEVICVASEEEDRAFLTMYPETELPAERTSEKPSRWEMVWLPPSSGPIVQSEFHRYLDDHDEHPWHLAALDYEVEEISGVVDLCLLGDERRIISDLRYQLSSGQQDAQYGMFVRTSDGRICQLQQRSDEKSVRARARRRSEDLDRFVAAKNLPKEKADELRQWIEGEYLTRLLRMDEVLSLGYYMPAGTLPEGAEIGVHPTAIDSLIQVLKGESSSAKVASTNDNGSKKPRRETDAPWWEPHPSDPPAKMRVFTPARYFGRQIIAENPKLLSNKHLLAVAVVERLHEHKIGRYGNPDEKFDVATLKNAFSKVDLLKPHVSPSHQ